MILDNNFLIYAKRSKRYEQKIPPKATPDLWEYLVFSFSPNAPTPRGTHILTMNIDKQLKTLEMAILHGSHFEKKLADAGIAADPINRAKIFKFFPSLVEKYGPQSAIYKSTFKFQRQLRIVK